MGYEFPVERSNFSYHSIKPVYVIVLMEESPHIFHEYHGDVFTNECITDKYIQRSRFSFDTGLKMNSLQNFIYISLDIFRVMKHNNLTVNFRFQPKELITMYSDALRIMDQNMVKYIIDELKTALSQKDSELSQKNSALSQKDSELSQKDSEIERLRTQLAKYEAQD